MLQAQYYWWLYYLSSVFVGDVRLTIHSLSRTREAILGALEETIKLLKSSQYPSLYRLLCQAERKLLTAIHEAINWLPITRIIDWQERIKCRFDIWIVQQRHVHHIITDALEPAPYTIVINIDHDDTSLVKERLGHWLVVKERSHSLIGKRKYKLYLSGT